MKKYKLINKTTKEEHLCTKVVVDGFNSYVNDNGITIATENPSINIPKVIDEVGVLSEIRFIGSDDINNYNLRFGFEEGYNKAKETYSFTEEDMVEFLEFLEDNFKLNSLCWVMYGTHNVVKKEELLEIWKEQRVETIYFQ